MPFPGPVSLPAYQPHYPATTPTQLVPRTVQPVAPRTPVPAPKAGLTIRPAIDRHFLHLQQLLHIFPEDRKWLVAPMQLLNSKLSAGAGIHIFVDASNILIGFRDKLKYARTQLFDLSFDSLALLLERRRPVARRVLAGSSRKTSPLPFVDAFITKAEEVGYENNVYEQVYKEKELTDRQRFFRDVDRIGYKAAVARRSGGESSDSETGAAAVTPAAPSPMKWVEQGVDENLHLKMCQSILDADEPATMVLATGDGAAAEYSDGFLAHVERALKRGWTVELVSWKQQINGGYTKKKWQAKWGAKFKVIFLDDFVESLIET
ncbi:hypothetical protein BDV96DRAFT_504196 [Lophiotrema nucula]|uniref:NYN domain-containing protein n=1 Tax=Lophiotrema nucula TaxID=690887 RepID=A0A6A5YPR3_9PLEO|nr:hypothetical protein BDV96DRAFT_504196 [Lophiotrema nucula]